MSTQGALDARRFVSLCAGAKALRTIARTCLISSIFAGSLRTARGQGTDFKDDFSKYGATNSTFNSHSATTWDGTSGVIPAVPYINGGLQVGIIPIDATTGPASEFIQPRLNGNPEYWPFGRTSQGFLSVQFDLAANVISGQGTFGVYFTSAADNRGPGSAGPFGAVVITATGSTATAQVWAMKLGGTPQLVGNPITLPAFSPGSMRSFHVDFGWDYFTFPSNFTGLPPPARPSGAYPWADLRISWLDTSGWMQPDLGPGRNGWVEFGSTSFSGYGGIQFSTKEFDRYDWPIGASGGPDVYVHWFSDRGSGGSVTWSIDNVFINSVTPQPFTIMTNQLGYDTAGPQWVAMRANDPQVRQMGASAITSLAWTLYDATGVAQRSSPTLTNPAGEQCFKEPKDPELWNQGGIAGYQTLPLFWWRWEWPPVITEQTGWYVVANGTLSGGTAFHVQSDPIDLKSNPYYSSLIADPNKNIAVQNGHAREAVDTAYSHGPTNPDPGGGWFDAGNENGENRSHATFISAFCNFLRRRRPQMSTAEVRDAIRQIEVGCDFLLLMAVPENSYMPRHNNLGNPVHVPDSGHPDEGHHLLVTPTPEELQGHIFHEHHTRYPGYTPSSGGGGVGDFDDDKNTGDRMWMCCASLADASRTLKPFTFLKVTDYFNQATSTRDYLYNLDEEHSKPHQDFYVTFRAQALLDFMFYDYTLDPNLVAGAAGKLVQDLQGFPPTTSDNVGAFWIQGGLFRPNGDPPAYIPIDPLLYCIEHGIADIGPTLPPHPTWQEAVTEVDTNWYQNTLFTSTFTNPLRIGRCWSDPSVAANDFYGGDPYLDKRFAQETYAAARLAQNFGRGSSQFDRLVHLALGNLNWLLGIHPGVLSRHVHSAPGLAENDLEFSCAGFVNGIGRRWTIEIIQGLHQWDQPTLLSGVGGSPIRNSAGAIINWSTSPFSYSRADYTGAESYIKTDGHLMMAVETLGRLLHPFVTVEAESYSTAALTAGGAPVTQSNNEHNTPPAPDRLNGGLSIVGLVSGDQLGYSNLLPPEPFQTLGLNTFHYRTRLRASNAGVVNVTVTVSVTQSGTTSNRSFTIPPTPIPHVHEYLVFDDGSGYSLPLLSGTTFSVQCAISGPGPCAIDDFVFESDGIGQ